MPDWYRNIRWDAEVEAAFEAKLARARGQRAQYLRIQGSLLKDTDPEVAIRLLERCIEAGEPMFVAHALLDTAHALYRLGQIDAALDTLEALLEQERREPRFRTSAEFDYPFLVAIHQCRDRYGRALDLLNDEGEAPFASMSFEQEAARALIQADLGESAEAGRAARAALELCGKLGWIAGFPEVGAAPDGEHPLFDRLRSLAAQSG